MADSWAGALLNRSRRIFDKALELKAAGVAIVATTSHTGINFECRKQLEYVCVVDISACPTGTNETYVFSVEVSDLVGGTYTAIATKAWIRGNVGKLIIPLSGATAQVTDDDADWIRLTMTAAGSSPSITYQAYLSTASV